MALTEITWQFGLVSRKQSQARLPRNDLFSGIGPQVAAPAVRPSLACRHHLRTDVVPIASNARQAPPIIIIAPDRDLNMLVQHALHQHRPRCLTAGLADLGRIKAVNAQLAGRAPCVRAHPERVTIRNK